MSEAIRIGAMMTKQTFGRWGDKESTCAIGAAVVGFGGDPKYHGELDKVLDEDAPTIDCPDCSNYGSVGDIIMHRNDKHRTPRNEIADWLEGMGL